MTNWLEKFGNVLIANDPVIATASGWKYNPKVNKWELSKSNLLEAELLRDNLSTISILSPTHPATAFIERVVVPGVTFVGSKSMPYYKQIVNKLFKSPKNKFSVNQFKDPYGREIIPTPYSGPDSELILTIENTLINVLKDYFSPKKVEQLKTTIGWGDKEIAEFQQELLRSVGTKSLVYVKGPEEGFTIIGQHKGTILGTGNTSKAKHVVTLNRERVPNLQIAEEVGIHELGVHGKTLSMKAEDFGKGGYSDNIKKMFPRMAELTAKNRELAESILLLNKRGQFLQQFTTAGDLEQYFYKKGLPWDRFDKFNNQLKYYRYVTKADELTARAYTGLLYEKLHGSETKTLNIKLLEKYFTPESVEKFKKAVLGISPIIPILNNKEND